MIAYPAFNPVAMSLGPLHVYWYGIMYLLGFLVAWLLARYRVYKFNLSWRPEEVEDFIFYAAIGVILGGRLGYMFFYSQGAWLSSPLSIFYLWEGGMSFHGGLVGVMLALLYFARKTKRSFLEVTDFAAPLVPLGIAFGRFGNFINGELWGRETTLPWGMVFPKSDGLPRHPSQLYELGLEGILLFILVWSYASRPRQTGRVSAVFLIGYSLCRMISESFRQPDNQIGFLAFGWLTMGELLSLPFLLGGLYLWWRRP